MNFFYVPDGQDGFLAQPATASPWGPDSQHGGPPAALLTRAIERLGEAPRRTIGRFTMELLGPVPVGPLAVSATVLRPGRSVELRAATLVDRALSRPVATATAWMFPDTADGPRPGTEPPGHAPEDGQPHTRPPQWSGGYLDAVEWRWVKGSVWQSGPAVVWMRPRVGLVEGETTSPLQRLMACADSASGVSAELEPSEWGFQNTELTVHVLRPPVGEWLCLDAVTTLGPGRVGTAVSEVYDGQGLVARTAQALLVARR
ncbi:MAG TPA: thioesterase family protein [Nocardioidaceae bacterium]